MLHLLLLWVWETAAQVQYPSSFTNFMETYNHNLKAKGVARYLQNFIAVCLQWACIKIPKPNCLQAYQGIYMVWGFDVLTTQPICDMNSLPRHFHDVIYLDAKFQLAIVPFFRIGVSNIIVITVRKNNIYQKQHFVKRNHSASRVFIWCQKWGFYD